MGIALSVALAAGIAPATAIAAEISSPTDAVALQAAAANSSETAATEKDKAYAAMQEALKNLEAAKDAASPEKIAEIDTKIAIFQKNYDTNLARAAIYKESLPTMQADIDAAQSECDKAHNRTRDLEAELNKIPHTDYETRLQLELAIMDAQEQESRCEDKLEHCRMRLESQKSLIYFLESEVEFNKTHLDGETAKRDALLDNLKKAQAAYDDACKAYEEAKAAADKAARDSETVRDDKTLQLSAAGRDDTARQLARDRQRHRTELHQAGEHEQRQASRYDRRQAREHGRHSAERNRTRSSRRRRPRNNRRSHTPHQELKIAASGYCLRQSTSQETRRGPFPHLRKRASLTAKIQATAPPPLEPRSHQCPDNANEQQKARD